MWEMRLRVVRYYALCDGGAPANRRKPIIEFGARKGVGGCLNYDEIINPISLPTDSIYNSGRCRSVSPLASTASEVVVHF